ncbi:unnamed protein product, partial [Didymodactylos carnosus]
MKQKTSSTSEQEREQTNSEDNGKQMVEQAYDDEESDEEEQIPMAEEIEELVQNKDGAVFNVNFQRFPEIQCNCDIFRQSRSKCGCLHILAVKRYLNMTEGQCQAATNMKNVRKALRARVGVKKTGTKRPTVLDKEPAHQRKQINNTKTVAGRPSKLPQVLWQKYPGSGLKWLPNSGVTRGGLDRAPPGHR